MASIHSHNLKVYSDKTICDSYTYSNDLQLPESEILSLIGSEIQNRRILDIGIGTGRTTEYLLKYTKDYIGVDYSEGMVKHAKEIYRDAEILQMDARDLNAFGDESFDLVFFSFNGIDYMNHTDRMQCIKEVTRVLRTGGFFVFSSHNIHYERFNKFIINAPKFSIPYFKRLIRGGLNRLRNLSSHMHTDEYSIITDPGHDYNCITYYIASQNQESQLKTFGYKNIRTFGIDGAALNAVTKKKNAWIYYLAQK